MNLNPEIQYQLPDSKFSSISKLVAFQAFQKEKLQRKQIEQERKNIELNVAQLYRQAKKASKQLNRTQAALVQNLNKKSSKQEEQRLKEELKRLKQEQLHQLRNNNSLSRYMNMLKRQQAKHRLTEQNRQMSLYIKTREKHDQTIKKLKKIEQSRLVFQKNLALGNGLKVGVSLAKTRNFYQKKCLSSVVRNELLEIENLKIQKQKFAIEELSSKRFELKQIFSKARQQNDKYQVMLDVGRNRSFVEMYELVAAKEGYRPQVQRKKKRSTGKKRKYFSQSKIVSSYLGSEDCE